MDGAERDIRRIEEAEEDSHHHQDAADHEGHHKYGDPQAHTSQLGEKHVMQSSDAARTKHFAVLGSERTSIESRKVDVSASRLVR